MYVSFSIILDTTVLRIKNIANGCNENRTLNVYIMMIKKFKEQSNIFNTYEKILRLH